MKTKVQAQRKFAQGAYVPPSASVINTLINRRADPNNGNENRYFFRHNTSARRLLDSISFEGIHTHKPVVVLERLQEHQMTAMDDESNGDNDILTPVVNDVPSETTAAEQTTPTRMPSSRNHTKRNLSCFCTKIKIEKRQTKITSKKKPKKKYLLKRLRRKQTRNIKYNMQLRSARPASVADTEFSIDDDKPLMFYIKKTERPKTKRPKRTRQDRHQKIMLKSNKDIPTSTLIGHSHDNETPRLHENLTLNRNEASYRNEAPNAIDMLPHNETVNSKRSLNLNKPSNRNSLSYRNQPSTSQAANSNHVKNRTRASIQKEVTSNYNDHNKNSNSNKTQNAINIPKRNTETNSTVVSNVKASPLIDEKRNSDNITTAIKARTPNKVTNSNEASKAIIAPTLNEEKNCNENSNAIISSTSNKEANSTVVSNVMSSPLVSEERNSNNIISDIKALTPNKVINSDKASIAIPAPTPNEQTNPNEASNAIPAPTPNEQTNSNEASNAISAPTTNEQTNSNEASNTIMTQTHNNETNSTVAIVKLIVEVSPRINEERNSNNITTDIMARMPIKVINSNEASNAIIAPTLNEETNSNKTSNAVIPPTRNEVINSNEASNAIMPPECNQQTISYEASNAVMTQTCNKKTNSTVVSKVEASALSYEESECNDVIIEIMDRKPNKVKKSKEASIAIVSPKRNKVTKSNEASYAIVALKRNNVTNSNEASNAIVTSTRNEETHSCEVRNSNEGLYNYEAFNYSLLSNNTEYTTTNGQDNQQVVETMTSQEKKQPKLLLIKKQSPNKVSQPMTFVPNTTYNTIEPQIINQQQPECQGVDITQSNIYNNTTFSQMEPSVHYIASGEIVSQVLHPQILTPPVMAQQVYVPRVINSLDQIVVPTTAYSGDHSQMGSSPHYVASEDLVNQLLVNQQFVNHQLVNQPDLNNAVQQVPVAQNNTYEEIGNRVPIQEIVIPKGVINQNQEFVVKQQPQPIVHQPGANELNTTYNNTNVSTRSPNQTYVGLQVTVNGNQKFVSQKVVNQQPRTSVSQPVASETNVIYSNKNIRAPIIMPNSHALLVTQSNAVENTSVGTRDTSQSIVGLQAVVNRNQEHVINEQPRSSASQPDANNPTLFTNIRTQIIRQVPYSVGHPVSDSSNSSAENTNVSPRAPNRAIADLQAVVNRNPDLVISQQPRARLPQPTANEDNTYSNTEFSTHVPNQAIVTSEAVINQNLELVTQKAGTSILKPVASKRNKTQKITKFARRVSHQSIAASEAIVNQNQELVIQKAGTSILKTKKRKITRRITKVGTRGRRRSIVAPRAVVKRKQKLVKQQAGTSAPQKVASETKIIYSNKKIGARVLRQSIASSDAVVKRNQELVNQDEASEPQEVIDEPGSSRNSTIMSQSPAPMEHSPDDDDIENLAAAAETCPVARGIFQDVINQQSKNLCPENSVDTSNHSNTNLNEDNMSQIKESYDKKKQVADWVDKTRTSCRQRRSSTNSECNDRKYFKVPKLPARDNRDKYVPHDTSVNFDVQSEAGSERSTNTLIHITETCRFCTSIIKHVRLYHKTKNHDGTLKLPSGLAIPWVNKNILTLLNALEKGQLESCLASMQKQSNSNAKNPVRGSNKNSDDGAVAGPSSRIDSFSSRVSPARPASIRKERKTMRVTRRMGKAMNNDNNEPFPKVGKNADVGKIVEAPKFTPTEEEFRDPIAYFQKIMPEAAKHGICKVIAPAGFQPSHTLTDSIRFTVTNQYLARFYSRWGPVTRELCALRAHLLSQSISYTHAPLLDGLEVNIPKMIRFVQRQGGLKSNVKCRTYVDTRQWNRFAEEANYTQLNNPASKLDHIYMKYLIPYDALTQKQRQNKAEKMDRLWSKRNDKLIQRAQNPLHRQKRLLGESDSSEDEEYKEDAHEAAALNEAEECVVRGRAMNISNFKKISANAMKIYSPTERSTADIETQYWRFVLLGNEHVCVNTASIDTGSEGYGFSRNKSDPYGRHPWNLKMFIQNPGNVLRLLGPVLGVTVPTLHVGMIFSTSCWHRDPHSLPWIEYMHTGPNKIWYGIPDSESTKFRRAVETLCPSACQNKSIWLPSDITMIPPTLLLEKNVSMSRLEQKPGEYVIVFPKAYSCSISTGYTVSESVYFATNNWVKSVNNVFQELRQSCEPTMFPLEKLLIAIARDPKAPLTVLQMVHECFSAILSEELENRRQLERHGLKPIIYAYEEQTIGDWNQHEYECEICRSSLYLSRVRNVFRRTYSVCLRHALQVLDTKNKKTARRDIETFDLEYFFPNAELEAVIANVIKRLTRAI